MKQQNCDVALLNWFIHFLPKTSDLRLWEMYVQNIEVFKNWNFFLFAYTKFISTLSFKRIVMQIISFKEINCSFFSISYHVQIY